MEDRNNKQTASYYVSTLNLFSVLLRSKHKTLPRAVYLHKTLLLAVYLSQCQTQNTPTSSVPISVPDTKNSQEKCIYLSARHKTFPGAVYLSRCQTQKIATRSVLISVPNTKHSHEQCTYTKHSHEQYTYLSARYKTLPRAVYLSQCQTQKTPRRSVSISVPDTKHSQEKCIYLSARHKTFPGEVYLSQCQAQNIRRSSVPISVTDKNTPTSSIPISVPDTKHSHEQYTYLSARYKTLPRAVYLSQCQTQNTPTSSIPISVPDTKLSHEQYTYLTARYKTLPRAVYLSQCQIQNTPTSCVPISVSLSVNYKTLGKIPNLYNHLPYRCFSVPLGNENSINTHLNSSKSLIHAQKTQPLYCCMAQTTQKTHVTCQTASS
jgi:hypothetical protein